MTLQLLSSVAPGLAVALCALFAVCGAVLASFVTCAADRMARGASVLAGRSRCDACGHVLGPAELVPVVSWAIQRGRCRQCGAPIGARCLVGEVALALLFAAFLQSFGLTLQTVACCGLATLLWGLSLVDLDVRRIPNAFVAAAVLVWLAAFSLAALSVSGVLPASWAPFSFFGVMNNGLDLFQSFPHVRLGTLALAFTGGDPVMAVLVDALLGAFGVAGLLLAVSALYDRVAGVKSLGAGDVKLFFAVGLYLGFAGNLLNLLASCALGAVFGLAFTRSRGEGEPRTFPFGPAIAASTVACLLWGPAIVGAYLNLF